MKVLVDADFILEALLNRKNLIGDARKLWNLLENKEIQGFVTDIGVQQICIYVKKLGGLEAVKKITTVIKSIVKVKTVDRDIIEEARSLNSLDFDSAVEIVCAYAWRVDAIVTQNIQHFSEAELHIFSISQLLERKTLDSLLLLNVPIEKRNNIIRFTIHSVIAAFMLFGSLAFAAAFSFLLFHDQSFFSYEHSGKGLLASSDFYDNPLGLRGEDNSLTNDFYNDTRQDRYMIANFDIEAIYTLEEESLISFDTDSQMGVIPEIQFNFPEKFNGLTNDFYNDSRENIFFYDNPFDLHSESSDIDGVNTINDIAFATPYTESGNYSITITFTKVPEPSNLISLSFVSVLGLGVWYKKKKNWVKNNKNNLQKSVPIPPISNLNCVIDDSKTNETETLPK